MINDRVPELGDTVPSLDPPLGNYTEWVIVGRTAHLGGHGDTGRGVRD